MKKTKSICGKSVLACEKIVNDFSIFAYKIYTTTLTNYTWDQE